MTEPKKPLIVHVYPANGARTHDLNTLCWCRPMWDREKPHVLRHNPWPPELEWHPNFDLS